MTAVILASIVVPLVVVGWLCWFFWKHRHDE
jgi:heme/copper-type cytochrome/quinol oxidase subunit 2